jgi:succinate-semialdehyde dehydrogenase/glutarate-semialdehyde dehydrogenase
MFSTTNPFTGKLIANYQGQNALEVEGIIQKANDSFGNWKIIPFSKKGELFVQLAALLRQNKEVYSSLITAEMGKIISESRAEIEKCAWLCEYYAENAERMLAPEYIESDASKSFVSFEPIGIIYAIMPWNFPFWQVFRAMVPTIMAGNVVVLKHAPNVFGCAVAIEKLFIEAGFPNHIFSNLIITVELSEKVIAHPMVQGVTITGSQRAGSIVASQAGKYLKKCVLELGGSDPFIIMADADFNPACQLGTISRMLNSGQVCIAAKRFIVEESILADFTRKQRDLLQNLKLGDPMDENTQVGPMARIDLLEQIEKQVEDSLKMGAKLFCGGRRIDNKFYSPTLLFDVQKGMPVYDEETFGPVAVVIPAKDTEEAVHIANDTPFGLGASIWTKNLNLAEEMAAKIDAGAVFINGMVKSDPRLPFGGIKRSGFGRELSSFGIREFTNIKTVWIA